MSSFTKPLIVKKISWNTWELYTPFEYYVGDEKDNDIIIVPKGFTSDFASIPRFFWQILPPFGNYTAASIIHDWGYHTQDRTRKEYDRIFLNAMGILGVPFWKRRIMFRSVRIFGRFPWNKRAKILKKKSP